MSSIIDVRMNTIEVSSKIKPIIGTSGLATCIGILVYDSKQQKAIVAHISPSFVPSFLEVLRKMRDENFINVIEYQKCAFIYLIFEKYDLFKYDSEKRKRLLKDYCLENLERKNKDKIRIIIIDGYYQNASNVSEYALELFSYLDSIFLTTKNSLSPDDIITQKITNNEGHTCFYFDTSSSEFVTKEVVRKSLNLENKFVKK